MFLTRFEINPRRRAARSLLASPQRVHAAVLASFSSSELDGAGEGRVLWRLDEAAHDVVLYVVSPFKPDLTHLVESVGRPATQAWDTRDYSPLLERLEVGGQWGFRLTANPVRSGRKNTAGDTQRFGHVTVAQQTRWLLDRTERHGFVVTDAAGDEPDVAVRGRRSVRFERGGSQVTLSTATFEGRMEVRDPAALRAALVRGIGPAKGYGCGLLTLAR